MVIGSCPKCEERKDGLNYLFTFKNGCQVIVRTKYYGDAVEILNTYAGKDVRGDISEYRCIGQIEKGVVWKPSGDRVLDGLLYPFNNFKGTID